MLTLGIESSCDDTSIAILRDSQEVVALLSQSQVEKHRDFGGIVPEIAARSHTEALFPLLETLLAETKISLLEIDLIAATCGPGLIGSLLVGWTLAKVLAFRYTKPLVAVHHLEAHFCANFLEHQDLDFPMIGLLISGGHTCLYLLREPGEYQLLGSTRDDAVGELYDKVARQLGLGMPGGPQVDRVAAQESKGTRFTPPMLGSGDYDFSFSGLKTACLKAISLGESTGSICFGMQEAVVKVLLKKTFSALAEQGCKTLLLAGGVSANSRIRKAFSQRCEGLGVRFAVPSLHLCTDNGAMVARCGFDRFSRGFQSGLEVEAFSKMPLENLKGGQLWL
jgi:N6-L-threonylcarbamoyladenine synthase